MGKQAGLSLQDFKKCKQAGVSAQDFKKYKKAGLSVEDFKKCKQAGLSLEDFKKCKQAGLSPQDFEKCKQAGLSPHEFKKGDSRKSKFTISAPARESRKDEHPLSRFKKSLTKGKKLVQENIPASSVDLEMGLGEKSEVTLSKPAEDKGIEKKNCTWL